MTARDFLGFPSLQEVECSGKTLKTEVTYLSLTLYSVSDNSILAKLNTGDGTCKTFAELASCELVESGDRRNSVVKTLVSDLGNGEKRSIGCNVTGVVDSGHPKVFSWIIYAKNSRKL